MNEIPVEHREVLNKILKEGSIFDYEQDGEWDSKSSNGPGRTFGVFHPAIDDNGWRRYVVWLPASEEEDA